MSLASAWIQWTDAKSGLPRFIKFDVIEKETHTQSSDITEHPVEDGANVSDHVRHNLDEVSLDVLVSNSPITDESLTWQNERSGGNVGQQPLVYPVIPPPPFFPTPGAIFGALEASITAGVRDLLGLPGRARPEFAQVLNFPDGAPSKEFVFTALSEVKEKAVVVEVVTPLRIYEDMLLINIDTPRTAKEGDSMRATLRFKHMRRVQSKLVSAPAASIPRAKKTKDNGKKDTPTPSTGGPDKTFAKAGKDALNPYVAGFLGLLGK